MAFLYVAIVFTVALSLFPAISFMSSVSLSPLRLPQFAVPDRALRERVVVVVCELRAARQRLRRHDGGNRAEAGVVEGAEVAVGSEGMVHLVAQGGCKTIIRY